MSKIIWSAALNGLEAVIIAVEADSGGGDFGQITIVGLPDAAVSESKERVRSALRHCELSVPKRKITVNLAPADFKKRGPVYDLPIAISVLSLQNNFKFDLNHSLIVGELSLSGQVYPVAGILPMILAAQKANLTNIFIPYGNLQETLLINNLNIFPVQNLQEIIRHLKGQKLIAKRAAAAITNEPDHHQDQIFLNIKGQNQAKRALEISAAGGHNLLLFGPPGSGKTMLAKSMPSILPPLTIAERLELSAIYSAAGQLNHNHQTIISRPFRAPHHSSSSISLLGGGSWPKPGEVSLAHHGVLFLDEFLEFTKKTIDGLRQPLEDGEINISRAAACLKFPANFILIAATNPCPCGFAGDPDKICSCRPQQIASYQRGLSGPILDRFDLRVQMLRPSLNQLSVPPKPKEHRDMLDRILRARHIQFNRFLNQTINARMSADHIKEFCLLDNWGTKLLEQANEKLNLSARSYYSILKTARTIADLSQDQKITPDHLSEALQYRPD